MYFFLWQFGEFVKVCAMCKHTTDTDRELGYVTLIFSCVHLSLTD